MHEHFKEFVPVDPRHKMMSVCHPYGQEIVCLCENVHTVLRCHLVNNNDQDNNMEETLHMTDDDG